MKLEIVVPGKELFDSKTNEFIYTKETHLTLMHSLISVSKWESKWKVPFLDKTIPRTREQNLDYIRCMTLTQNVDPLVYTAIDANLMKQINEYINDPMTATWFSTPEGKTSQPRSGKKITSEVIYAWMIDLQIDKEYEKWNLNRLMTLIEVLRVQNQPSKKMSQGEILRNNAALNAARRAKSHSKG